MPEVDLVFPRAFVEFVNPADDSEVMRCDLTWLTSSYTCIFGQGCPGIYSTSPDVGCCTLGAHFAGKADEKRVAGFVKQLDERQWQFKPEGRAAKKKDWIETDDEGERKTLTIEVDGQQACVFHNREDFHLGAGCALHALALEQGPQPAGDQAGRVLAAAHPAYLPRRRAAGRHDVHRGLDRRVRPARLGRRAATTSTGTAPATPRRMSPSSRSTSPRPPS